MEAPAKQHGDVREYAVVAAGTWLEHDWLGVMAVLVILLFSSVSAVQQVPSVLAMAPAMEPRSHGFLSTTAS
jgi:hypothetical protein